MPVVQVILRAVDQMSNPAKQAEGALSSLKKQVGALGVSLGAMGVVGVAATTVQMVKLGVEVHRAEQAVIGFTGSAKAAKEAIAAVQAATGGAVSGMAAAQITSKLFAMGLAKTADEAAKLTDIAVTLGASMGKGPQEAFEEFTLLLANQSILRLDTFGISGSRVRTRITEMMAATKGLTREQAFLAAVMEESAGKMDALAAAGFEATSSIDVLNARLDDAKHSAATFLSDGLIPIIDGFMTMDKALEEHGRALVALSPNYEEYIRLWGDQSLAFKAFEIKLNEADFAAAKLAERASGVQDGWEAAAGTIATVGEVLASIPDSKMIGIRVSTEMDKQSQEVMRLLGAGVISVGQNWATINVEAKAAAARAANAAAGRAADAATQGQTRRGGKQQAAGGPLADFALVGEQGPEMIINGVVIPAGQTRRLMQMGLVPGKKHGLGGPLEPPSGGYTGDAYIRSLTYSANAGYYLGTGGARITGGGSGGGFGVVESRGAVSSASISPAQTAQIVSAVASSSKVAGQTSAMAVASQIPTAVAQQTREQNEIMARGQDKIVRAIESLKAEIARSVRDAVQTAL